ncbi:arginase family protein [Teichococcus aestuarii]|uniref:arginase family protein n=1 Tax=Teichococcus aestuarii TaxID=568898 RepID=UPI00361CA49C
MTMGGQGWVVFGAAADWGAGRRGAAEGPAALRAAGLLEALGTAAEDRGDLPAPTPLPPAALVPAALAPSALARLRPEGPAHHLPRIAAWVRAIRAEAAAILASGRRPLLLGGDHSLPMGSVAASATAAAAAGRPLYLLWMDAHGDFNTPATSPSGNVHGMALAALCGEPGLGDLWGAPAPPPVAPSRLALLGVRDLDPGEARLLRARGAAVLGMDRLRAEGLAPLRRFLEEAVAAGGWLHVSLDVDVLDPTLMPGTGTPVPGGLSQEALAAALALVRGSGLLRALDLVELNPRLDPSGASARRAVALVAPLLATPALRDAA